MAADDVQLPDLEVIQRYSLAIRTASAPRADVIAALQADLDWLTSASGRPAAPARTPARSAGRTPAKASTRSGTEPAPPKRAARRTPAKRTSDTSRTPAKRTSDTSRTPVTSATSHTSRTPATSATPAPTPEA